MPISLSIIELKKICADMAALGAARLRSEIEPAGDSLSQRQAFERYGQGRIRRWEREGLLKPKRNGPFKRSKLVYSVADIMAIEAAEKMAPVINWPERNDVT